MPSNRLYNSKVTITRKTTSTISAGLEVVDEYETVKTKVPIRITDNSMQNGSMAEGGFKSISSNVGFVKIDTNILPNDILTREDNTTIQYVVNGIDKEPGGKLNSHYEAYLTLKDYSETE